MAKVNIQYIRKDILRAAPQFKNLAYGAALSRFNRAKNDVITSFLENDVTKEIEAGPTASHSSEVVSAGNLFSFIGFEEGSDPVTPVVNMLEEKLFLRPNGSMKISGDLLIFSFTALIPTKKDIEAASPLPFQGGRSWVLGIEEGISGVSHYLFHQYFPRHSRSSTGLQSPNEVNKATFAPRVGYLTNLLKRFKKEIA